MPFLSAFLILFTLFLSISNSLAQVVENKNISYSLNQFYISKVPTPVNTNSPIVDPSDLTPINGTVEK